jgi:hypothetical protein
LAKGTQANGYYARPPLVRIHDLKGTGLEAECIAILDSKGQGQVASFKVISGGKGYSDSVVVGLYSDHAMIPESSIANRENLDAAAWADVPFNFSYAFGDTRARHLYFVGEAHTRFRDQVEPADEEPMTTEPRRLELVSSARPPKPEIAYLLPAYVSRRLEKQAGRLTEERDAVLRCYLHRPWNMTGDERLGVVVYSAQLNTSRVFEDANNEGLIPAALRKYVSRWGFDPIWDDTGYAPLTIDDFTNAVDVVRYDDLGELSGTELPPVSVALHQVQYSAEKDLWYADVAVRAPKQGMPFVQLALVRYQPNSVQGLSISEVVLADPITHPGYRRLTVQLSGSGMNIDVSGNFDSSPSHAIGPTVFVNERSSWNCEKRLPIYRQKSKGLSHMKTSRLASLL